MSRRSTVSTSETTTTTTNTQEEVMNATATNNAATSNNTQNTNNTQNQIGYTIVCPDGHSLFVTERMAQRLLAESAVAEKEYDRKAKEETIGKDSNVRAKNPEAIKYDRRMDKRTKLMKAFIHNVFRGVQMPEDELDQMIEALSK